MYNWGVKIPGKEKKTIVRNTNLVWCLLDCLFCLSKLLLLLLPWWLFPPLRPTLPSTTGSTPGIARNFTHRYSIISPPRYFPHDQCGERKYSNFRGEISYFTHELYAQNCIKYVLLFFIFNRFVIIVCISRFAFARQFSCDSKSESLAPTSYSIGRISVISTMFFNGKTRTESPLFWKFNSFDENSNIPPIISVAWTLKNLSRRNGKE